jgi:phosphotransferase system HPr-like phosphotransfer protein
MKKVMISLTTIADIRDLVNIANRTDVDIDLISGRYVVDAKSIMGIFSLDVMKPIELIAHTDDEVVASELFEQMKRFIVA